VTDTPTTATDTAVPTDTAGAAPAPTSAPAPAPTVDTVPPAPVQAPVQAPATPTSPPATRAAADTATAAPATGHVPAHATAPAVATAEPGAQPAGAPMPPRVDTALPSDTRTAPAADEPAPANVQTQDAMQADDTVQHAASSDGGGAAVAVGVATIAQSIWQAQVGCVAYCVASTQIQSAVQAAAIVQTAQAAGVAAAAVNAATIVQDVLQLQIGCLIHCSDTTQTQSAGQMGVVAQQAVAVAAPAVAAAAEALGDLADRLWSALRDAVVLETSSIAADGSRTTQRIRQIQLGCHSDCAGTAQAQSVQQAAATAQAAAAIDANDPLLGTFHSLFWWLSGMMGPASATNRAVTTQEIRQAQISACRAHCTGVVQVQSAVQYARIVQDAVAVAAGRPDDVVG
jgi:hypothetical protein